MSTRPPASAKARRAGATSRGASWRLEEAKARFSELVRRARASGPQHVTVRGQEAVVVLSAEDYARLAPAATAPTLAALFGAGPFARLETFDGDAGRERPPVRDAVTF
jgi:prevent-host-death family protein